MKIVVSPNPYRDKQFKHARQACQILKETGAEVSLCLPFDVDRSFEIPSDLRFREIQKEIRTADMLICFGGDGTILHSSKIATEHGLPILGVNIGTMGFIAELEASEMELLRKLFGGFLCFYGDVRYLKPSVFNNLVFDLYSLKLFRTACLRKALRRHIRSYAHFIHLSVISCKFLCVPTI